MQVRRCVTLRQYEADFFFIGSNIKQREVKSPVSFYLCHDEYACLQRVQLW